MTLSLPLIGYPVTWREFHATGTERWRTGSVWDEGPRVNACRTLWVLPQPRLHGDPACVLAVVVDKRHRVGGAVSIAESRRLRWSDHGGRWVEAGEMYSEMSPRSITRRVSLDPIRRLRSQRKVGARRLPPDMVPFLRYYGGGIGTDTFAAQVPDVPQPQPRYGGITPWGTASTFHGWAQQMLL